MTISKLGLQLPSLDDFMELRPLTVTSDIPLMDAVTLMSQPLKALVNSEQSFRRSCPSSYALVLEDSLLVGVVTERDVVKLSADAVDLNLLTVREVMTSNVVTLKQSDFCDIYQVISILHQHQIRHLPVIDGEEKLLGIVSSESIAKSLNPTNLLKLRRVADVVNTQVLSAMAESSVLSLSQQMAQARQSCVVIVESDNFTPQGIITERDIVQFQILGLDLANTPAQAVMSGPLIKVQPTDSLLEVQQQMTRLRIRRMVVTNEFDQLQGIVTLQNMLDIFNATELYGVINTLQKELVQQTQYLRQEIAQRQAGEKILQENQQLLELYVRYAPAAIAMFDSEMRYLMVSDRWAKDYQLQEQNLIGRTHYEIFPELPEYHRQNHQDILQGKIPSLKCEEDCWERAGGRVEWLRWELMPWHNQQGEIAGLLILSEVITERKLLEKRLRTSEDQLRRMFRAMADLVFTMNVKQNLNTFQILPTKFLEPDFNQTNEQIIEQLLSQLSQGGKAEYYRNLNSHILETQQTFEFEYRLQLPDSLVWFSINVSAFSSTEVIWVARDITRLKQIEHKLFAEKELAQVTLKSIGDAVITTDELGKVNSLNSAAEQLTGWLILEMLGQPLDNFFQIIDQVSRRPLRNPISAVLHQNKSYKSLANPVLISKGGVEYAIEHSASPIQDSRGKLIGVVMVFRDVTESRNLAKELSWQATHDPLTGLYNRRKFEQQLELALQNIKEAQVDHSLCYLDLDRFKIVNDTCGHAAGDKLLQQITQLFKKTIRSADVLARLGGDEFGLLLYHCPLEVAYKIAVKLRKLVESFCFSWEDKRFKIGVSIGVVAIKPSDINIDELLNKADTACYAAKEQGRNRVCLYHEQDSQILQQHGDRRWVEKINRALAENRFCLYAQKIVDITKTFPEITAINSENSCHFEILLRMIDEHETLIAPGAFLPTAERYNLMPAIDRWVISTFFAGYEVFYQSRQQQQLPLPQNFYTINLSGASINDEQFCTFLQEQLKRYSIPPQTICFEITETVAISNFELAVNCIQQLKSLGCAIALDDFGSGMCSFGYLKKLPVDYLKIDGSFVRNIATDHVDYATVECFNHISQIMEIKTIAEFVEDEAALDTLRQIGIDYAQGYGIEKPKPLVFGGF